MKNVKVMFYYTGTDRKVFAERGVLSYTVASNNIPMGVAKAQYALWRDLRSEDGPSVARFDYVTGDACFVA